MGTGHIGQLLLSAQICGLPWQFRIGGIRYACTYKVKTGLKIDKIFCGKHIASVLDSFHSLGL